jgi:hypothetical protein
MRGGGCVVALALTVALAGCGAASPPTAPAPVTGLVVAILYSGDVASIKVSGAAEASGRHFGPWTLSSQTLTSGATVGFIFDPSDGGSAMICAETRDPNGQLIDVACGLFPVRAGEVMNGSLTLGGHQDPAP